MVVTAIENQGVQGERYEGFAYKTVPHALCVAILDAYQSRGSLTAAFYGNEFPLSWATFSRVVKQASQEGLVEMQPQGGNALVRQRARKIAERYPLAAGYSREEQARMAGCGVSTIYRAAPDKKMVRR